MSLKPEIGPADQREGNQQQLNEEYIDSLAEKLGLDMDQFDQDLNAEEISDKVEDDFESGVRSGVTGTKKKRKLNCASFRFYIHYIFNY